MAPLPIQQLTRLHLKGANLPCSDILALIAGLPQLAVLEVIYAMALELSAANAVPLSQLPTLRFGQLVQLAICGTTIFTCTLSRTETSPVSCPAGWFSTCCFCSGRCHTLNLL